MMFLVSAAGRYQSSDSDVLTVAVFPFSGIQSDAQVQVEDLGFINLQMVDSPNMEDGEYYKRPAPKVSTDLDDPYAMVPETQR
jgi:hypothetical protein